jgi:hypothetical protein
MKRIGVQQVDPDRKAVDTVDQAQLSQRTHQPRPQQAERRYPRSPGRRVSGARGSAAEQVPGGRGDSTTLATRIPTTARLIPISHRTDALTGASIGRTDISWGSVAGPEATR